MMYSTALLIVALAGLVLGVPLLLAGSWLAGLFFAFFGIAAAAALIDRRRKASRPR